MRRPPFFHCFQRGYFGMPIPAGPIKLICNDCNWHSIIPQRSDVIILPSQCPQCRNEHLTSEKVGAFDEIISILTFSAKKIFK